MMKQQRLWTSIRIVGVLLVFLASLAFGGLAEKDKSKALEKTTTNDLYRPFLINNIFNYYSNNGDGSFNKFSTDNEGFEFLKGDGKHIIFEDGVVWGGYHKGRSTAKVGGSVYRHGLQAGAILTPGTATTDPVADDPSLAKYRVFRVRPDINPTVPFSAVEDKINNEEVRFIARYESYTAQDIYDQYIADWNEWPAAQGAPYKDVDSNGVYDPTIDIPGQPGSDQTLWYVANDMNTSRVNQLSGSPSIGLEMQRTIWGYRRTGALGVTIFASSLIINKSGAPIDTMYMVQWADPDLGDAGDDFAGCDVPRSLGYIYNGGAVDATYGVAVPAGGFDFFQGPIVASPGDSAIFRLKYRNGYKNLPMTAFVFFTQGNAYFADPTQGSGGDIEWYRLMKGTVAKSGDPFIDFSTNQPTVFCLSGDPVTGTGWIDGMGGITPQDRRICLVTGPFRMAAGDTQELVVANLAGVGADRLSSITVMRDVDDKAQSAYDNLFRLPGPPPNPTVAVAQLDGKIILTWGDAATITKTEGTVDQGFTFEGYKVYEFPGSSTAGGILLGTWDLVDGVTTIADTIRDPGTGLNIPTVLQKGTDNGLIRSITLTSSKVTGTTFVNGTPYYFAVTAYSYNPDPPAAAGTHALESSPLVIRVVPQTTNPGVRYLSNAGDTLTYTKTTAAGGTDSDGRIIPIVVDPTRVTGHSYKVTFNVDATSGETQWSLIDVSLNNKVVLSNLTNQSGDDNYPIVDGLLVKVVGPPPGMKGYSVVGNRHWTWAGADPQGAWTDFEGFNATMGWGNNWFSGTSVGADKVKNVRIQFATADGTWDPLTAQADTNFSKGYRYLRRASVAAAEPSFAPWIINTGPGTYPYQDFNWSVPFAAYDIESTPPRRLAVGCFENNATGGLVDGRYWPPLSSDPNADNALVQREWFFVFDAPYSTTPDPSLAVDIYGNTLPIMWWSMATRRDPTGVTFGPNTSFTILANHINSPATTFAFTAPTVVQDASLAKADVEKVNVFPNPYIGFNPQEQNKYARFVTFTHLPQRATLRIFSLAGILIRTLQKNDGSQYFTWDLNNEGGFPAAAGMYFVYIDMPDQGVTKTLKLGIIPEQQYLDRW